MLQCLTIAQRSQLKNHFFFKRNSVSFNVREVAVFNSVISYGLSTWHVFIFYSFISVRRAWLMRPRGAKQGVGSQAPTRTSRSFIAFYPLVLWPRCRVFLFPEWMTDSVMTCVRASQCQRRHFTHTLAGCASADDRRQRRVGGRFRNYVRTRARRYVLEADQSTSQ